MDGGTGEPVEELTEGIPLFDRRKVALIERRIPEGDLGPNFGRWPSYTGLRAALFEPHRIGQRFHISATIRQLGPDVGRGCWDAEFVL